MQISICALSLYLNIRSDYTLTFELTSYKFKLSIPVLTKATDEGLLEELVYGKILFPTLQNCHLAYVPAVIVERLIGTIVTHANGIEMT